MSYESDINWLSSLRTIAIRFNRLNTELEPCNAGAYGYDMAHRRVQAALALRNKMLQQGARDIIDDGGAVN